MVRKHFLVFCTVLFPDKSEDVLHIFWVSLLNIWWDIRLNSECDPETSLLSFQYYSASHTVLLIVRANIGVMLINQLQKLEQSVLKDDQAQRQAEDTTDYWVDLIFSFEIEVGQMLSEGIHSLKHFSSGPRPPTLLLFCAFHILFLKDIFWKKLNKN